MSARHQGEQGGGHEPRVDQGVVRRVVGSVLADGRTRHLSAAPLPDGARVGAFVEMVRSVVFPGFFGDKGLTEAQLEQHVEKLLGRIAHTAEEQIRSALRYESLTESGVRPNDPSAADELRACGEKARAIAHAFVDGLPELRDLISLDVQAAYDGDPAARHTDEVILCYPGIDAVFAYRVAHALQRLGAPLIPRLICEQAHGRTGVDIHPGAKIGRSFFIDHGVGVVIGETTVIGDGVKIYQGVTLGAKSFPRDERGRYIRDQKRHPTIGNRVTIYAGAVILGGDTLVGDDCVISGGVFVTESVPAKHVVRQKRPELVLRSNPMAAGGK